MHKARVKDRKKKTKAINSHDDLGKNKKSHPGTIEDSSNSDQKGK